MAPITIKVGKRGSIVLPIGLRRQLGLEDGSLLIVEANGGEIRLRPAFLQERPADSEERDYAIYILLNSRTREEWDRNLAIALEYGATRAQIQGLGPDHRDTLPTHAEWAQRAEAHSAARLEALHSS